MVPQHIQERQMLMPSGPEAVQLWLTLGLWMQQQYGLPLMEMLPNLPVLMMRSVAEVW